MDAFPTGGDYVDALHHPGTCLTDPRLAAASVELTALGRPRPRSGASACVFRLSGTDGRRYAVKCFTRAATDQQLRYAAIAEHLAAERAPWQVTFEYQNEGILVHGRRWPILAMDWVDDALDLAQFVDRNLRRPRLLGTVAGAFARTCEDLQRRRIAHGDLQHGNVLVTGNGTGLRLIDYDGMWIPRLADRPGIECGQPNYQPPFRLIEHSGQWVDRFSAWVIYVSLVAVAVDAGIWQRLDGGDECLLLRAADFADPAGSEAFDRLAESPSPMVRRAAAELAELCRAGHPDEVPPLDATAFAVPALRRRRSGPAARPRIPAGRESMRRWRLPGPFTLRRSAPHRPPRIRQSVRATISVQRGRIWPGGERPPRPPRYDSGPRVPPIVWIAAVILIGIVFGAVQNNRSSGNYRPGAPIAPRVVPDGGPTPYLTPAPGVTNRNPYLNSSECRLWMMNPVGTPPATCSSEDPFPLVPRQSGPLVQLPSDVLESLFPFDPEPPP